VKPAMQDNLRRFKAGVFQALAHPTRIAIIELLRDDGEVPVSTIYERLGLEQANASQHLAILRSKQIVVGRKEGNQVFYSLRDPILGKVLNLMRQYFQAHLNEALELLKDMNLEEETK
jgi:DNA-binding transcriptional ArsR family regulator